MLTVTWTCYPSAFAAIASTLARAAHDRRARHRAARDRLRAARPDRRPGRAPAGRAPVRAVVDHRARSRSGPRSAASRRAACPPGNAQGDLITSWLNPTSIAIGVVAVATTAYISAVWLTADAARDGEPELRRGLPRARAVGGRGRPGAIAFVSLIVVRSGRRAALARAHDAGPAIAAVIVSAVAGVGGARARRRRAVSSRRASSRSIAVAAIIAGWALAQRPELLPGLTISQAAAGRATLVATLIGLAVGSLILIPSLGMLFRMVLGGTFSTAAVAGAARAASRRRADPGRRTALCVVGLVAGALVLVVGDAAWSIALGASLLLVARRLRLRHRRPLARSR